MPEILSVSAPEPIYDGSSQVGWRQTGAVSDDTRALVITVQGDVSIFSVTVGGAAG